VTPFTTISERNLLLESTLLANHTLPYFIGTIKQDGGETLHLGATTIRLSCLSNHYRVLHLCNIAVSSKSSSSNPTCMRQLNLPSSSNRSCIRMHMCPIYLQKTCTCIGGAFHLWFWKVGIDSSRIQTSTPLNRDNQWIAPPPPGAIDW
jgi:hypothetical protein